jgi:hypothetical protein
VYVQKQLDLHLVDLNVMEPFSSSLEPYFPVKVVAVLSERKAALGRLVPLEPVFIGVL